MAEHGKNSEGSAGREDGSGVWHSSQDTPVTPAHMPCLTLACRHCALPQTAGDGPSPGLPAEAPREPQAPGFVLAQLCCCDLEGGFRERKIYPCVSVCLKQSEHRRASGGPWHKAEVTVMDWTSVWGIRLAAGPRSTGLAASGCPTISIRLPGVPEDPSSPGIPQLALLGSQGCLGRRQVWG